MTLKNTKLRLFWTTGAVKEKISVNTSSNGMVVAYCRSKLNEGSYQSRQREQIMARRQQVAESDDDDIYLDAVPVAVPAINMAPAINPPGHAVPAVDLEVTKTQISVTTATMSLSLTWRSKAMATKMSTMTTMKTTTRCSKIDGKRQVVAAPYRVSASFSSLVRPCIHSKKP